MAKEDLSKLKIDKYKTIPTPKRIKKILFRVVIIAFLVALGLYYGPRFIIPLPQVEVATVSQIYPSQTLTLLNASGYVVAQRKAAVSSKVTGRLEALMVEEGSRVKEGQVIARLENEDVKASVDQAEANLTVAKAKLELARADLYEAGLSLNRDKRLLGQGILPQANYDTQEARYKKAVASVAAAEAAIEASAATLREAKVALDYTFIRIPFEAVVLTKNADIGDIVTPLGAAANAKAAVVTIADMSSLQVEVDISESNLEKVQVDQPCEIQLDALPSARFRGSVHMIVPTADRTKATVMVKVRFLETDSRILPEMSAKVALLSRPLQEDEQKSRTAINPAAIVTRHDQEVVFIVKDDHVVETKLEVGAKLGDLVEVLAGVKAGDVVVIKPSEKVKDQARIRVAIPK